MANKNPITRAEFNILRDYVKTTDLKELARETGRSVATLQKIKRAGTWPKFQNINKSIQATQAAKKKLPVIPADVSPSVIVDEKNESLLDSNLTKKQAKAFLDMQTDNRLLKGENIFLHDKIKRLEGELADYRNRETADILKKARASRSILRFLRRTS